MVVHQGEPPASVLGGLIPFHSSSSTQRMLFSCMVFAPSTRSPPSAMTSPIFKGKKGLLVAMHPPLSYHPIFLLPFKASHVPSSLCLPSHSVLDPRQPGICSQPHQQSGTLSLLFLSPSPHGLLLSAGPPTASLHSPQSVSLVHFFHQGSALIFSIYTSSQVHLTALNNITMLSTPQFISPTRPPPEPQIHPYPKLNIPQTKPHMFPQGCPHPWSSSSL